MDNALGNPLWGADLPLSVTGIDVYGATASNHTILQPSYWQARSALLHKAFVVIAVGPCLEFRSCHLCTSPVHCIYTAIQGQKPRPNTEGRLHRLAVWGTHACTRQTTAAMWLRQQQISVPAPKPLSSTSHLSLLGGTHRFPTQLCPCRTSCPTCNLTTAPRVTHSHATELRIHVALPAPRTPVRSLYAKQSHSTDTVTPARSASYTETSQSTAAPAEQRTHPSTLAATHLPIHPPQPIPRAHGCAVHHVAAEQTSCHTARHISAVPTGARASPAYTSFTP